MSTSDFIERLERGDRISAEQYNLRGDLHRREEFGSAAAVDPTGAYHRAHEEWRQPVLMKNGTGAERDRYEIAGIDAPWFDPATDLIEFKYRVAVTGVTPSVPTHNGRFGVFQEKTAANQPGLVKMSGVTQVQVDIQSVGDSYCDVKDGSYSELVSNSTGGSMILLPNPPDSTGIQWCIVRIGHGGGGGTRGVMLAEDHPGRGLPFDVWLGTWNPATDGWDYDTSETVKAIDWRYDVPYPEECATGLAEARASDTYGTIWEIVALDCSSPGCGSGS